MRHFARRIVNSRAFNMMPALGLILALVTIIAPRVYAAYPKGCVDGDFPSLPAHDDTPAGCNKNFANVCPPKSQPPTATPLCCWTRTDQYGNELGCSDWKYYWVCCDPYGIGSYSWRPYYIRHDNGLDATCNGGSDHLHDCLNGN